GVVVDDPDVVRPSARGVGAAPGQPQQSGDGEGAEAEGAAAGTRRCCGRQCAGAGGHGEPASSVGTTMSIRIDSGGAEGGRYEGGDVTWWAVGHLLRCRPPDARPAIMAQFTDARKPRSRLGRC